MMILVLFIHEFESTSELCPLFEVVNKWSRVRNGIPYVF